MLEAEKQAPLWYHIAANLPLGRDRVLNYLLRHNKLDRLVHFAFHDGQVIVPLSIFPHNLSKYQHIRISAFANACVKYLGEFDFIDCGANIGLFSAQFSILAGGVRRLTAIEPYPLYFRLLQANLASARAVEVECVNAAISDFAGRGRLVEPNGYAGPSDAMYIVNDPHGDIQVITLADVLTKRTRPRVAIKLDVEGAEVPVMRGAADAIRSVEAAVLFLEVHAGVLARIGMSDVEMLAQIEKIRSFRWLNSSDGTPIDPRYPILAQTHQSNQCDLIGLTTNLQP
jgi:FkbM family methyltransferase